MFLKRLELYGFKSFAHKTVIEFDQGITAIVGPNGSGKSNVSDAVRWVLGEQSAKSLRGTSMQDVIFNGTEKRKPLSVCEVTLVFDNTDGGLPIEYTEVAITRRAYRNGDSEYLMNQKQCRLKDITEILHNTGIGKEGYSIIGQGRINDILSTKSEDRRLVLEEAAGITKYKANKAEAERKIEHAESNVTRIEDILDELESQLGPLEQQSKEAREYLALREQLKSKELNVFIHQQDKGKERMAKLLSAAEGVQQQHEQRVREDEALKTSNLEEDMRRLDEKINATSAQILQLSGDIERRQGENRLLQERIENGRKQEERLRLEIKTGEELMRDLHARLHEQDERIRLTDAELKDEAVGIEEKEHAYSRLTQMLHQAESELETKKNEIISMMNRLNNAKTRMARLETIRQSAQDRRSGIAEELKQSHAKIKYLEQERAQMTNDSTSVMDRYESLKRSFHDHMHLVEKNKRMLADKQTQLRQSTEQFVSTQSKLNMLIDMKRQHEGFAGSVQRLLQDCDRNLALAQSIEGVVASILKPPKEIEIAIETALGAAAHNIITPTEQDAKRLIEHLRRNNYGRATFMPRSSVKERYLNLNERALLKMEGVWGVACELLSYDSKFERVVANLLGRTVVVEDMDKGIALMKKAGYAFRAVTLQGDILSPGGTISGGSMHKRTSGLLGRDRMIEELKEQVAQSKQTQHVLSEEIACYTSAVCEQESACEEIRDQIHELEVAVAREKEKLDALNTQLQQAADREDTLLLEQSQLQDNIQDIDAQMAEYGQEESRFESDNTATREDVIRLQQHVTQLREKQEARQAVLTDAKVHYAAKDKELQAHRAYKDQISEEINRQQKGILQKQQEMKDITRSIQESMGSTDLSASQENEERTLLNQKRQEQQHLEEKKGHVLQAMEELKSKRFAIQAELSELQEKRHKLEMQRTKLQADLENGASIIWNEYELTYAGALEYQKDDFSYTNTIKEIAQIKVQIRAMGDINPRAIEDFKNMSERYEYMMSQREDLLKAKENLLLLIEELTDKMRVQFKNEFDKINENFSRIFTQLFGGGSAQLRLQGDDVLNSPIEIDAQPPGKRLQSIMPLSGGEKSLVALTLLFAILALRPAPFCMLDEVDTSLDELNVDRFASFIKKYRDTQFILITHRKNSMSASSSMFGVAMEEKGVSKVVSVRMEDAAS
ncbi:MAG: chromosome segregation protein SMC [Christensenellales bacterium]